MQAPLDDSIHETDLLWQIEKVLTFVYLHEMGGNRAFSSLP